jgi:hypothetical protein
LHFVWGGNLFGVRVVGTYGGWVLDGIVSTELKSSSIAGSTLE